MTAHVALVRGINVGGRTKVAMADLRRLFEEAGCAPVTTYIQSGNVVFGHARPAAVVAAIERAMRGELGVTARILWRSAGEMADLAARNPLPGRDETRLAVTFLEEPAGPEAVSSLEPERFAPDEFVVEGRHVYLHCPNGYGRTKLSNAFLERRLGSVATTRNWNTVLTLTRMSASPG
ncbi:MAG TPA: DUF1697 domain-containing protein [Acidimicrobiales bacterium]|nr:DUF1697 domain-containing protein [Acidimicrobiales bacterium]